MVDQSPSNWYFISNPALHEHPERTHLSALPPVPTYRRLQAPHGSTR